MDLIELGKEIIKKIYSAGFCAYIVGGTVRDMLLSLEINDCDLTTNMPLSLLKEHFKVVENGSEYESVTIIYKGESFEITHFRSDVMYLDHRHPKVELVDDYYSDSKRRDFTINALAMDFDGKIIDYYDGLKDLSNKTIKTIGNPVDRFNEDALRILRGLYFASKLNFDIEENTLKAIDSKKGLLNTLSEKRLYQYFIKILYAKTDRGIRYINELDLFKYIPKFKKWLSLVDKTMKEEDLIYYYYLKEKDFPITVSKDKYKIANNIEELINDNSNYSLYKNQDCYFKFKDILKHLGCDIIGRDVKYQSLIIKNDKELALSKEEIASYFLGKEKSIKIDLVIKAILDGKIKNEKEEIRKFILK